MNKQKFQPSNGSEQMNFTETYCMKCVFCDPDPDGERQCDILCRMIFSTTKDDDYPDELTYDKEGKPICTKHKHHDWKNDGIPELPINDPNQQKLDLK